MDAPLPDDPAAAVLALVAAFAPAGHAAVDPSRPLTGDGGLGFDSVRLVELVLACEERLGVDLDAEALLRDRGLTPDALVAAALASSGRPS